MAKERRKRDDDGLTEKQSKFILLYPEKMNVYRTAEACGIAKSNIIRDIQKDTAFGREVRRISKELEGDPRFSKVGTLSSLYDMEVAIEQDDSLESRDKYRLLLDIRKEINKMIDGNIASQKKTVEKKIINVQGVYDLTALPESRSEPKTIDITHKEV